MLSTQDVTIQKGCVIRYAPTKKATNTTQVWYMVDEILSYNIQTSSIMCKGTIYQIDFETGENLIMPVKDVVRKFGRSLHRSLVLDGTITIVMPK